MVSEKENNDHVYKNFQTTGALNSQTFFVKTNTLDDWTNWERRREKLI